MYKFDPDLAIVITPNNEAIELRPINFKLLNYLVENNQRLVSKRELITWVWKSEVSDSSINKSISQLRSVFNDSATKPEYISTRRKLGYRLIANVNKMDEKTTISA